MDEFTHTNLEERTTKPSIMKRTRENPKTRNFIIGLFSALAIYGLSRSCDTPNEEEQKELISQIVSRDNCNKEIDNSKPIITKRIKKLLYINNEHINLKTNIKRDESQLFIYTDTIKKKHIFNVKNINNENINGIPSESKLIYTDGGTCIQVIDNKDGKKVRTITEEGQQYLGIVIFDKAEKSHIIVIGKLVNKVKERKTDIEEILKNLKNSSNRMIDLSLGNKVNIVSAKLGINGNNIRINHPYHLTPTSIPYSGKGILTIYINNNQSIEPHSFYIDIPESREENLDNNFDFEPENNSPEENNNQNGIQQIIKNIERINKLGIHHQTLNQYNQLISDIKLISTTNDNDEYNKTEGQLITTTHLNSGNIYSHIEKSHKDNPNNIYLIANSIGENLNIQSLNDLIKCSKLDNVIIFLNFTDIEQVNMLNEIQTSNINKNRIFITIPDDLIGNLENYELKLPDGLLDGNFGQPIIGGDYFSNSLNGTTIVEISPNKHEHKTTIEETITPQ